MISKHRAGAAAVTLHGETEWFRSSQRTGRTAFRQTITGHDEHWNGEHPCKGLA